jgi:branched-subunit amino acid transport protein
MKDFTTILGMFLVTFGVRYPVLAVVSRLRLPELVTQALKFVPPAVLMAIIAPPVLLPDGERIALGFSNAPLYASLVAVLVAWRTKNLLATILVGMGVLWSLRWGLGGG